MLYRIVCIDALTDRKSSFKQGAMPNLSATINNHTNIGPQSNPLFCICGNNRLKFFTERATTHWIAHSIVTSRTQFEQIDPKVRQDRKKAKYRRK